MKLSNGGLLFLAMLGGAFVLHHVLTLRAGEIVTGKPSVLMQVPKSDSALATKAGILSKNPVNTPQVAVKLENLLQDLSINQYEARNDYQNRAELLKVQLSSVGANDWIQLSGQLLRGRLSGEQHRTAVYLLSLAGPAAIPALEVIAKSPLMEASDPVRASQERSLRLGALEYLDKMASDREEARQALRQIAETQNDAQLSYFSTLAVQGINEGKPGKLHRLLVAVIGND